MTDNNTDVTGFQNRVVLITGGTSGMGLATARLLLEPAPTSSSPAATTPDSTAQPNNWPRSPIRVRGCSRSGPTPPALPISTAWPP